jgi:hypothetical protein
MSKAIDRSRESVALLVALLVSSCAGSARGLSVVDEKTYKELSVCWLENEHEFRAFLVVAKHGADRIPYIISADCAVLRNYKNLGESTLDLISALRISDNRSLLQSSLGYPVSDNIRTELSAPEANDPVYFIRGALVHKPTGDYYEITEVKEAKRTGVSFGDLLSMSLDQRSALAEKFLGGVR